MAKGKHKRKKQRAQQKAEQAKDRLLIAEKKEMAENQTKSTQQTAGDAADKKRPQRWVSLGRYLIDKSSFTDWCIAAFTLVLAAVAIYQYQVMGGQLTAMLGQLNVMRNDERAWLEVKPQDGIIVHVDAGNPIRYPLRLSNIGKTPAKNIVWTIFVDIQDHKQDVPVECVEKVGKEVCNHLNVRSGILFPNAHWDIPSLRVADDFSPKVATQSEADAWESGAAYAAGFGMVTYDDIFGGQHWTKFCFWTPPDNKGTYWTITNCTKYNEVGDK